LLSLGIWASLATVAPSSIMIERHVTLSRQMWGTDQAVSLEQDELSQMVQAIRAVETAMGSGEITILPSERETQKIQLEIGGVR